MHETLTSLKPKTAILYQENTVRTPFIYSLQLIGLGPGLDIPNIPCEQT